MTINTAIITTSCIATINESVDCLLDAMIEAQNRHGQISWDDIRTHRAHGTYRAPAGGQAPITVVDTAAPDLHDTIYTWIQQA